jgi:ribonuclease P protein component
MDNGTTSKLTTIQHRSDFLLAAAKGKRFIAGTFILQMLGRQEPHPSGTQAPRVGYTVTRKIGNAVIRNRTKRRLREAVKKAATPHMLPGHDYVIISRHKAIDCPFSDLLRDMEFAFSRIPYIKNTQQSKPKQT